MVNGWKIIFKLMVSAVLVISNSSCNKNVLEQFADKGTDDAIYYAAQQQLNARNYTGAINTIGTLSSSYFSRRNVQFLLASAYSGRCGLDFIPLADALTNMSTSVTLMDVIMSQLYPVAGTADCETAETLLRAQSSGNTGVFTDPNEALQMATVAMAKVGAILAISSGAHANGGAITGGYDPCTISDADTDEIGTGLTLAYNNLQVNPVFATSITNMTSMCLALAGPPINDNLCAKTTSGFSATELKAIRSIVNYNQVGIGSSSSQLSCGPP